MLLHNGLIDRVFDYKVLQPNQPLFVKSLLLVNDLDHLDILVKAFEVFEIHNQYSVQKELKKFFFIEKKTFTNIIKSKSI